MVQFRRNQVYGVRYVRSRRLSEFIVHTHTLTRWVVDFVYLLPTTLNVFVS